jgi:hypothetical protein
VVPPIFQKKFSASGLSDGAAVLRACLPRPITQPDAARSFRIRPRSLHHRCGLSRPQRPPITSSRFILPGQKRRLTPQIRREFKRPAVIEPVIGHFKGTPPHGPHHLAEAVLAAAGHNFRRLFAWLTFLLLEILIALGLAAQLNRPKIGFFTADLI